MRLLIAGGTGAIGRHAVPLLLEAGHNVKAVSRRRESDARLRSLGAEPVHLDIFDAEAATAAAAGVDAVVNLATRIPAPPAAVRMSAWEENSRLRRDASRALATAAMRVGARFVQESFAPTYPDCGNAWITEDTPLDPVAQTASVPDAEASAGNVTASGGVGVILRFGLFYGADSSQSVQMLRTAKRGWLALPGPRARYTSMIHLDDAGAAVVAALEVPTGVYNAVEDDPLPVGGQANALADLIGAAVCVRCRPSSAA